MQEIDLNRLSEWLHQNQNNHKALFIPVYEEVVVNDDANRSLQKRKDAFIASEDYRTLKPKDKERIFQEYYG